MTRWKIGAAGLAIVCLATLGVISWPASTIGQENGLFANDCCGTLELRGGRMTFNGKQTIRYAVGRDAGGPYILPSAYVGSVEDVGFEVDGTRSVTKLRLDRLPNPTRVLLYAGSSPYVFDRKYPPHLEP